MIVSIGRRLHRKIGRLVAAQDVIDIPTGTTWSTRFGRPQPQVLEWVSGAHRNKKAL